LLMVFFMLFIRLGESMATFVWLESIGITHVKWKKIVDIFTWLLE